MLFEKRHPTQAIYVLSAAGIIAGAIPITYMMYNCAQSQITYALTRVSNAYVTNHTPRARNTKAYFLQTPNVSHELISAFNGVMPDGIPTSCEVVHRAINRYNRHGYSSEHHNVSFRTIAHHSVIIRHSIGENSVA